MELARRAMYKLENPPAVMTPRELDHDGLGPYS